MEVIAPSTPWIAEDDVLLKNAVEAGASLEALAKGAVRFSRKFSFKELRDRWQSLLYDPVVSAKASVGMIEFELSTSSQASKLSKPAVIKETGENNLKRKNESIRRKYYAMRKRIRGKPFDDSGLDFSSGQRANGHIDQVLYDCHLPVGQVAPQSYMLGAHIITNSGLPEPGHEAFGFLEPAGDKTRPKADHGNMKMFQKNDLKYTDAGNFCSEYGERDQHGFNSPLTESLSQLNSMGYSSPKEPLWKMTEDISPPLLPITMNLQESTPNTEKRSNIPDDDHDCLLGSANEGSLLFMDVDGSTSMDKLCYDNLNSLLLSSPIYAHDESLPNDSTSKEYDVAAALITSSAVPLTTTTTTVKDASDPSDRRLSTENAAWPNVRVALASSVITANCSEIQDISGPCIMNTEVEEVPDNDVIFPPEVSSAVQTLPQNTTEQRSTIDSQQGKGQESDLKIENHMGPGTALGGRSMTPLKACSNHTLKSSIKAESPDTGTPVEKYGKSTQVILDSSKAIIMSSKSGALGKLGKAGKAVLKVSDVPDPKLGGLASPRQILEPISPDAAESESDDDVPHFSDIEAMVLEMDLCDSDHDPIGSSREMYQDEAAKKQIMRLEQCARSSSDRHIESRGAFAILYGRRLRHYIKKSEVILGRATEDMDVDIDLAREGRANKVSRRQASIKLEADGSFVMKNLGKFSISVNGTELVTGQCVSLTSSNLVEIRGMSFIFEANHRCVKRHLTSMKPASQSVAFLSK